MTTEALGYINDQLSNAGINYEYGEWTSDIIYPYFVGEYSEAEPMNEDGLHEVDFTLNGFTRGSWLELEEVRSKIEKLFTYNTAILDNNSGVAVSYSGSLVVPTGDAELKRIQINLNIKEWEIN